MPALNATFSTFADGGDLEPDDIVVGLRGGINTRFNYNGGFGIYLPLAGGTMTGVINMGNFKITGLATPTDATDAVTKAYADSLVSGSVNAGSINQMAWYAATGDAVSGLPTANSGLLVTSAGGVPSIATDIPTAVTIGGGYIYRAGGTDVPVADGGTGISSATAYSVICGGTTNTNPFQSVVGLGNAGEQLTSNGAGALPTWQPGTVVVSAALTKGDDTNVTLTLGGTPASALLQATSITAGWTGVLSLARGGTNKAITADNGAIVYCDADSFELLASTATAGKVLRSGASGAPSWSTATYPSAAGAASNVLTSDGTNWVSSAPTGGGGGFETNFLLMGG